MNSGKVALLLERQSLFIKLLFVAVLFLCYALAVQSRWSQFSVWQENPSVYFLGQTPLVSTADAPYYLRLARDYSLGEYPRIDSKREFPKGRPNPKEIPLLAWTISKIAPIFDGNFSLAGNWMVIWGAGLFIIPLGLYGWQLGYPLAGLLGGLIGGYTVKYYARTSVGRIDTDFLNLFFPLLTAYFLLRVFQSKQQRDAWTWSVLAGLTMYLFSWWYDRPGFSLVFFLILLIGLFCWKHSSRQLLGSLFLFIVCSGPEYFLKSLESLTVVMGVYLNISFVGVAKAQGTAPAEFPHAYNWIIETVPLSLTESLSLLLTNPWLSSSGLVFFMLFAIIGWRKFLPLMPIFGLGAIGLLGSQRFLLYLVPFVGFGFGLILNAGFQWVWQRWLQKRSEQNPQNDLFGGISSKFSFHFVLYLNLGLTWLLLNPYTIRGYVPQPSFPVSYYQTFQEIRKITPENAALYTWWDLGNLILEQTDRALFHDGGSQYRPKTYFIAKSLVSQSQVELAKIMRFLGAEGDRGIQRYNTSEEKLMAEILNGDHFVNAPLYLLYTDNLIDVFPTLFSIGKWDLQTQQTRNDKFREFDCQEIENQKLDCGNFRFDLKNGFLNEKIPLRRIVKVLDGNQFESAEPHAIGLNLQLMYTEDSRIDRVFLLTEPVYQSNLNQMFLLGNYDRDLFEETYQNLPFARMFLLRPTQQP